MVEHMQQRPKSLEVLWSNGCSQKSRTGLLPDGIREVYAATKVAHRPLDLSTEPEEAEKHMQQPKGRAHAS